jgi:hypothetical protein
MREIPRYRGIFEHSPLRYALETDWLVDSNLYISESEFGQLSARGVEKSNLRISIEGCRAARHCQRKVPGHDRQQRF